MQPRHEEETERRSWFDRLHLSWPMLLLAGWLLYEFTAQPGLAALVFCAKFALADVRTAYWLRRVDPNRLRAEACFWAYLAYGLWKIAVMALVTMVLCGLVVGLVLAPLQGQPNNDFLMMLGGVLVAAVIGLGLTLPTLYIALRSARSNGLRIWFGEAATRARKGRFWPPHHHGFNAGEAVVISCCGLPMFCSMFMGAVCLVEIEERFRLNIPINFGAVLNAMLSLFIFFAFLFGLYRYSRPVIARTPQDCWSLDEEEVVYEARKGEEGMSDA